MKTIIILGCSALLLGMGWVNAKGEDSDPPASSKKADKAKKKEGDFVRGAQVWANNCNRCHNMRNASDYSDQEWKLIVPHMRVRANLTGQEARDVLKFLQNSN